MDSKNPDDSRVYRASEHAAISQVLSAHTEAIGSLRTVQAEQGVVLDLLATNSKDTAIATIKIAALNEAREEREIRKDAREEARSVAQWTWFGDNWKWLALGAIAIVAPEVVPRLAAVWAP